MSLPDTAGSKQKAQSTKRALALSAWLRSPPCKVPQDSAPIELAHWRQARTFFFERWRALPIGVAEAFWGTFFLMLAIKHHRADATSQAVIAAAGPAGLLLGPLFVQAVRRLQFSTAQALALAHYAAAALLLAGWIAGWSGSNGIFWFAGMGSLAVVVLAAATPIQTQFYEQNYLPEVRGQLFSAASTVRVGATAIFTWAAGHLLAAGKLSAGGVHLMTAIALAITGVLTARCPGRSLDEKAEKTPFSALGLIWKDREFGWLIVVWMFMGTANLMMFPLRMKFLIEPRFGHGLDEAQTGLLLGVLPTAVIFCTTWWWGQQFDRWNFFLLRAALNTLIVASNLLFFLPQTLWGFISGAVVLGFALAGSNLAWSLWVTKLAPPDKVADYMAVHTFFAGIRGILAPAFVVPLADVFPIQWPMWASCTMLIISVLLLGPEIKTLKRRRPGTPVLDRGIE